MRGYDPSIHDPPFVGPARDAYNEVIRAYDPSVHGPPVYDPPLQDPELMRGVVNTHTTGSRNDTINDPHGLVNLFGPFEPTVPKNGGRRHRKTKKRVGRRHKRSHTRRV